MQYCLLNTSQTQNNNNNSCSHTATPITITNHNHQCTLCTTCVHVCAPCAMLGDVSVCCSNNVLRPAAPRLPCLLKFLAVLFLLYWVCTLFFFNAAVECCPSPDTTMMLHADGRPCVGMFRIVAVRTWALGPHIFMVDLAICA